MGLGKWLKPFYTRILDLGAAIPAGGMNRVAVPVKLLVIKWTLLLLSLHT